jgi:hypothetical protein
MVPAAERSQVTRPNKTYLPLGLLRPSTMVILNYYQKNVACLGPLEHMELLTLNEQARKKIPPKTA